MISKLLVNTRNPDFDTTLPLRSSPAQTGVSTNDRENEDALGTPLAEGLNGGSACTASSDNGVKNNGQARGVCAGRRVGLGLVIWEVVVVLDRLQGGGLTEEAEMVHRHGGREECLDSFDHRQARAEDWDQGDGLWCDGGRCIRVTEWCLILYFRISFLLEKEAVWNSEKGWEQTCGPSEAVILDARASQPSIREISCTRAFTSFALVLLDLSWLSFARRHGWSETWTLGGNGELDMMGGLSRAA